MTRPPVLLLESLHPDAEARLEEAADVVRDASHDLTHVRAVLTRGKGRVDAALLERCPALEVVARAGVGLDNVDRVTAAERGVRVVNVPNALTETVAEHALALALDLRREVGASARAAREGNWDARNGYRGEMLAGARTAVLGLGAIGARTAMLLRAVGADVVTWSRSARPDPAFVPDLHVALEGAEVVSLHMALDPSTRAMIGAAELERVAPGAVVVNTARPAVVDRDALLAVLENGHVAGYAVDGFEPEPPDANDPLLTHPRVVVTPHVAALTRSTYRRLCAATVEGVLDVLRGNEPEGEARVVPPPRTT